MSATPSALRSTLTVSMTRGVAAVLTVAQGILSAQYFGTSLQKDCFLVAQTIPWTVSNFLIAGIYWTLMVNLAELGRTGGVRAQRSFAARILRRLALVLLAPILLVFARPLWVVHLVTPGFTDEKSLLTASLLRLTVFVAAGLLFLSAVRSLFETRGQFIVPAFISLANPLLSLIALVALVGRFGIYSLAIGPIIGAAMSLLLLTLAIPRHVTDPPGFIPAPEDPAATDRRVRGFWLAFLPMSIGANFGQINLAVDNAFASYMPTGSITMLSFAFVIVSNTQLLTTSTFGEIAFSRLTRAAVASQKELLALFRSQMRHMLLLTAPLSIGAFAMATPIVRLLFERGAFSPDATAGVAQTLRAYAPGMFFTGYLTLFSFLLSSKRRFTRIAITAAIIMAVNAVLDYALIKVFGLTGIALGTSLTILIHAVILSFPARAILGGLRGILDLGYASKVVASACLMGVAVTLVVSGYERWLGMDRQALRLLEVGLGLGIGAACYAGLLLTFKVREASELFRRLLRPLRGALTSRGDRP